MLLRRCVAMGVAGVIVILALAAIASSYLGLRSPKILAQVTLVYVGAQDCAPCRIWQSNERTAFEGSAEYARLSYREVKAPTLLDVMKDDFWPKDLRVYRDTIGRGVGAPFWLVIADGQVVAKGFGATQWHALILPKIKSLLL